LPNCGPHVCEETLNFLLLSEKKGELEFAEGKGRPSKQDAWSVEKITITTTHAHSN
jgi:hypothetical protein